MDRQWKKTITYDIYIGAENPDSSMSPAGVAEAVRAYMEKNEIDFSLHLQSGGYTWETGAFTNEKSVQITLAGGDYDTVVRICRGLKMLLEQEQVILTKHNTEVLML